MCGYTLIVLDTGGIQGYVFGTNNLRQNSGASYLVECATRQWVHEVLDELTLRHNVRDFENRLSPFYDDRMIDRPEDKLDAEVIMAGGGNTAILFKISDQARDFTRELSRKTLLAAPGLKIIFAHVDFDWKTQSLGGKNGVVDQAMRSLARRKGELGPGIQMTGMSVTAPCVFTGKPAVSLDEDQRLISAEVYAKLAAEKAAAVRLEKIFAGGWHFPKEFEELGGTPGESSYIAVIHTDGNDMGHRIERIKDRFAENGSGNRAFIMAMRAFSQSIHDAAYNALDQTLDYLISSINKETNNIADQVNVADHILPFRPIVFGGDDVTFVCDGRLGLSLTSYYLQKLSTQTLSDGEEMLCRAGVAVVKSHYPFSRAYDMAETLCASARSFIKANGGQLSAMDWHFAVTGAIQGLDQIRQGEYTVPYGSLLMRPVHVSTSNVSWRSWNTFLHLVTSFQSSGVWAHRRNKVKALREALRAGPEAVHNFLVTYEIPEARLPGFSSQDAPSGWQTEIETGGWQQEAGGRVCGYFDAIEAADFYLDLSEGNQK